MDKRDGVLLAEDYNAEKHTIGGQCMSEKLDGQRVWWDGGITTGLPVTAVPWAFNPKAGLISTGLWTRGFKNVCAAWDWVEKLPKGIPLDGEAWLGVGQFEELESIARTEDYSAARWKNVQYKCFDVPSYSLLFGLGRMRIKKTDHLIDCWPWVQERLLGELYVKPLTFENALRAIPAELRHEQERLPLNEGEALEVMVKRLANVTDRGGEGLMIRKLSSVWFPKRSKDLLKIKKFFDAEGEVVGYQDGEGRLKGVLGALMLRGMVPIKLGATQHVERRFKISGFTDVERAKALELFPIGSVITYRYNEITNEGMPRFGRYWRKHGG